MTPFESIPHIIRVKSPIIQIFLSKTALKLSIITLGTELYQHILETIIFCDNNPFRKSRTHGSRRLCLIPVSLFRFFFEPITNFINILTLVRSCFTTSYLFTIPLQFYVFIQAIKRNRVYIETFLRSRIISFELKVICTH